MTTYRLQWIPRALGILLGLSSAVSAQFTAAQGSPFPVGSSATVFPVSVAVANFNGGGNQDLAIADYNAGTVTVLLGQGAGGFIAGPGSPYAVGTVPRSVVVGDFNGDGMPDLAIANQTAGTVTVLLNSSTGIFAAATNSPFTVGAEPTVLVVGDFNGDGKLDLASTNLQGNNVTLLLGDGRAGSRRPPAARSRSARVLTLWRWGTSTAMASRTWPLLMVASNNVTVLLGNGSGGFTPAPGSPFAVGSGPQSVAVGDFNGDGKPDLAIANFNGSTVTVLLGTGTGGFTVDPAAPSPWDRNPFPWQSGTSTATASRTSPSPIVVATA